MFAAIMPEEEIDGVVAIPNRRAIEAEEAEAEAEFKIGYDGGGSCAELLSPVRSDSVSNEPPPPPPPPPPALREASSTASLELASRALVACDSIVDSSAFCFLSSSTSFCSRRFSPRNRASSDVPPSDGDCSAGADCSRGFRCLRDDAPRCSLEALGALGSGEFDFSLPETEGELGMAVDLEEGEETEAEAEGEAGWGRRDFLRSVRGPG